MSKKIKRTPPGPRTLRKKDAVYPDEPNSENAVSMDRKSQASASLDIPEATRYLVYDSKKCTGCHSCMFACSTAHEGTAQLSTARIQIIEDPFGSYPTDIEIATCKQCKDPACMIACPVGAIYADGTHMYARVIDENKCIGCKKCVEACHFSPSRVRFHPVRRVALNCDLCKDTEYWDHKEGKLICVEICPVKALSFTGKKPAGHLGYKRNLRGEGWKKLDLPVD